MLLLPKWTYQLVAAGAPVAGFPLWQAVLGIHVAAWIAQVVSLILLVLFLANCSYLSYCCKDCTGLIFISKSFTLVGFHFRPFPFKSPSPFQFIGHGVFEGRAPALIESWDQVTYCHKCHPTYHIMQTYCCFCCKTFLLIWILQALITAPLFVLLEVYLIFQMMITMMTVKMLMGTDIMLMNRRYSCSGSLLFWLSQCLLQGVHEGGQGRWWNIGNIVVLVIYVAW